LLMAKNYDISFIKKVAVNSRNKDQGIKYTMVLCNNPNFY
jgi:hypothetical protein